MSYENLKLISLRMEPDTVKKLDELAKSHIYWKRSDIIRNILVAVLSEFDQREIYDMIRYYYNRKNVIDAKFEITDELKPYEKK